MRKVASYMVCCEKRESEPTVIVIEGSKVVDCHPLIAEESMTEWMEGIVEIRKDTTGILQAYWNGKLVIDK